MRFFKVALIVVFLAFVSFCLWGCMGGSSSGGTTANPLGSSGAPSAENPVTVSGTIVPPAGMAASDFEIVNAFQTQTPASNGAFTTTVSEKTTTVTFAVATASNKVLSAISIGNSTPVTIDSQSTAETLVLLSPFLIANSEADFNRISQTVKSNEAVKNLAKVIETLYASSTASMSDPAMTTALSEAVKSVLGVLPVAKVNEPQLSGTARFSVPNSQVAVSDLKVKNFDMAVLTLDGSSGKTIKLKSDTGANGISTNVNWKVRIIELDPAKIRWDKSNDFLFKPEYIDGWTKSGGFKSDFYVKGKLWWLAKTWKDITDALDPLKVISGFVGDLLFPDDGVTVDHDGVYAVIAFSGTPSNDPNYPGERDAVFAMDWQYYLWQDAMIANLALATVDIVDTGLKVYTIYTGTEISGVVKTTFTVIKGIIKSLASLELGKWGFTQFCKLALEQAANFISGLPNVANKFSGSVWDRVKEFINIPLKSAGALIDTGIGIISAGTRIGDWLVNATPRETACVVIGKPWKTSQPINTDFTVSPNPITGMNSTQTITLSGQGFIMGMKVKVSWTGGS